MRILSVGNRYPPWSTGGYEISWAGAVAALRGRGHEVHVLTTRPDPTDRALKPGDEMPDPDARRLLRWYWRAHEFPPLGLRAVVALERANAEVLRAQLDALAPDVVMWWAMGGMSLSLLEQVRRARIPAVGAVGDDWMVYGPRVDGWTRRWRGPGRLLAPLAEGLTGVPARLDLDHGARWMFNSAYTLATARAQRWRLPGAVVAHPGVDPELFAPRPAEPWGWRLLCCGRLDQRKGIDTAVRALADLPAEAILTIHGDGEAAYREELAALAARLGVAQRVRFTSGRHEDIPDVYAAADALVFPVRWREPWGLVPLEAMAVGRPVLATRAGGGAAEYLRDGENCLQFPPSDAAALSAAVLRLAGDEPLRRALVAAGHETASRHTLSAFHDALEHELREAVRR